MDAEFMIEDVEGIIKSSLQLSEVQYDPSKVNTWTTTVIDSVLKGLQGLGKPFKYIVTCTMMQKNGAGLHTAAAAFWDTRKDGMCRVAWENGTLHCIVVVFGLAVSPSSQNADL